MIKYQPGRTEHTVVMLSEAQCLSSLNMSDSLIKLSLPCYEGFMKLVIWPEPESVSKINISCSLEKLDFLLIFRILAAMVWSQQILSLIHSSLAEA